ncbi:MAG: shikimate kinase [Chloroflexi bacterium]|nr:shikimate kinase [Chloroflexota bacterium]
MKTNIVLAGFMGTGKTTVGERLATQLGLRFVDTDHEIVRAAGCSIADLFAQQGEAAFRSLEAEICQRFARRAGQVVATGGGALLNTNTKQAFMATGLVVCLLADIDTILARVGHDPDRPLFGDRDKLTALMAARRAHYASLSNPVETAGRSPQEVTEEIIRIWQQR